MRPILPNSLPRDTDAPTALGGIRIIDFSRILSGPVCTLLLADFGADVIKIENPTGGDDSREFKPPDLGGEASTFLWANRNKRSITLDLRKAAGRKVAFDLIAEADVVVENFSTGVMDRFELSYEFLRRSNPALIYCAISAFGRHGEFAKRRGYDPVVQAESGFLSLNGHPDQPPIRCAASIMDISTGMMACNAILAALVARTKLGIGQYVEVPLFDDAVFMTGQYGMNYLITGKNAVRMGNGSATAQPLGVFESKNGSFYLSCANDRSFEALVVNVLNRPDLLEDMNFKTNEGRIKDHARLHQVLAECFSSHTREDLFSLCERNGVPLGIVRTIQEAFNSDEVKSRQIVSQIPHPVAGTVPNIASPIKCSGTPIVDPIAAPLLGQHTLEILKEMPGYEMEQIQEAARSGAFGEKWP